LEREEAVMEEDGEKNGGTKRAEREKFIEKKRLERRL
jgi:hypothetical protein